jgi:hypothetical protein
MSEIKLTSNTFLNEYIKFFNLHEEQSQDLMPNIEDFKSEILQMSSVYDISPILNKLPYLHAKILQNVFGYDKLMLQLLHKKF